MLIAEINPDHTKIIQSSRKSTTGRDSSQSNPIARSRAYLTRQSIALEKAGFKIDKLIITTLQAARPRWGYPGVPSLDLIDKRRALHRWRGREDRERTAEDLGKIQGYVIVNDESIKVMRHVYSSASNRRPYGCISVKFKIKCPPKKRLSRSGKAIQGMPQDLTCLWRQSNHHLP